MRRVSLRRLVEQLGQLGDGGRDCSRFIFSHEMARVFNLRREVDICTAKPLASRTMSARPRYSSMVQGGGKRRPDVIPLNADSCDRLYLGVGQTSGQRHQDRSARDQQNAEPVHGRKLLTQKHDTEDRHHDDAQLVDGRHLRRVAELERAKVAQLMRVPASRLF